MTRLAFALAVGALALYSALAWIAYGGDDGGDDVTRLTVEPWGGD